MGSLKSMMFDVSVRLGELGVVDGDLVKEFKKLEGMLSKLDFWELEEERGGGEKVRKFGKEEVKGMILSRNMGVSYEKIGGKYGCVGMMVRNVVRGNVYKDLVKELKGEGVEWNGK